MDESVPAIKLEAGHPLLLGMHEAGGRFNFSIFCRHATGVSLLLFDRDNREPTQVVEFSPEQHRTGDVWHIGLKGQLHGKGYAIRVKGPPDPNGPRDLGSGEFLLDPYAAAISLRHENDHNPDPARPFAINLVVDHAFDWEGVRPPRQTWSDLIIYETHIRGFTKDPASGVHHPGQYLGLVEKIPYLRDLGITAVELLPVQEFRDYERWRPGVGWGPALRNYWGYNPVAFFAPKAGYACNEDPRAAIIEFKTMIRELHRAGIEVILDVVFNHTPEGDETGPTISLRGLDPSTYYILTPDKRRYVDVTGCGNTLNCNHPIVRTLIIDCLRYWDVQLHSDLAEREARIGRLVDANIVGICIWQLEGQILEANDAFLRIVGYDREDLVSGRIRWTDMTPPEWHERDARLVQDFKLTGTLPPFEKEFFRKDGSRVPVLLGSAGFDKSGNQGVSFVLDLTERKRADEATRRSEKELRDVIETVPAMVWTALPDGYVDFINRRWQKFTGLSRGETLGWSWEAEAPFHPDDLEPYLGKWRASLATGQPFEAEMRIRRAADGAYRWLFESAVPLRDEHGSILKWYGFIVDIEDRKRAEEALHEAQAELAHVARVTTVGALTSSIAHEVNQPLGAIVTNANAALRWLAHQPPNLDEVRETLERIVKDGHRAGEVIGRVRGLLRKTETVTVRLDLNDLIQDTFTLVHGEMSRHRILLRAELAPDLPRVVGDRVQLQQVLLNLVLNGIEAMKDVAERPRELLIRSQPNGSGAVLVTVQDTGVGLDPQRVERVFEAFYTTKPEGMGMGLAICRSIIEAHGGRLWASANEPRGAVFQFTLPPETAETVPAEQAGQAPVA